MDIKDFIVKYWDEIKAAVEKIYFYIKDLVLANEAK